MDAKYILTKQQSNELYRMMKFIHDLLTKHKIKYFICGGTLLGAIRHQGIIPHDDDGDICILRKDVPKFRKLISYFDKHGYDVDEGDDDEDKEADVRCKNKKDSCTWFIQGRNDNSLGCDVFVMEKKGNKFTYADPKWVNETNGGKKCYFDSKHLFPLLPYRYGNFYLYGPHNAILHLNTCYGTDWNSKGQTLYDHRTGEWTKGKKKTLSSEDFLTIKPPSYTKDDNIPAIVCDTSSSSCERYFSVKSPRRRSK